MDIKSLVNKHMPPPTEKRDAVPAILKNNKGLVLSSCQDRAAREIVAWSFSDKMTWTLAGAAGTGKTTLMDVVLQNTAQRFGVVVSAPTHKAKAVVAKATLLPAETIQSLIGLGPDTDVDNFDINNPMFKPKNTPKITFYKLVIIDEASMLNTALFTHLIQLAEIVGCKLLFLGDKYQIPPVKEHNSPVFIVSNGGVMGVDGMSELKTLIRQSPSNPVTIPLMALRDDINAWHGETPSLEFTEVVRLIKLFNLPLTEEKLLENRGSIFRLIMSHFPSLINKETGEGYKATRDVAALQNISIEKFKPVIYDSMDLNTHKFLAFSNNVVRDTNNIIRRSIFSTEKSLVEGDIIMAYKTIVKGKETILTNSNDYIIEKAELAARCGLTDDEEILGYNIEFREYGTLFNNTSFLVGRDQDKAFIALHDYYHKKGRDAKQWASYYAFKNEFLLIDDLRRKYAKSQLPDGVRTVNVRDLPKNDFDYGYAITIHKSQGSTYNSICLNLKDIAMVLSLGDLETTEAEKRIFFYKLVYTGLSRCKSFADIYM